MPRPIPSAIMRKLYSKNTDTAFLCILTVTPNSESPIYLVNNDVDVEYNGQVYTSARFTITLPDDSDDAIPTSSIVFADIQNQFLDLIRNYDSISVSVEIIAAKSSGYMKLVEDNSSPVYSTTFYSDDASIFYDADGTAFYTLNGNPAYIYEQKSYIETYETKVGPYNMVMSNANGDATTATFSISIDDVGQYTFPRGTFNSTDFPAIY